MMDADVCCVYGGTLEEIYGRFESWLSEKEGRYLVFLQEDLDPSFALSLDPRVRFVALDQEEQFKQIAWEFVFLRFAYFDEVKSAESLQHLARFKHLQSGVHLTASDYSDGGEKVLRNVFHNARKRHHALPGQELSHAFKGIPAIICGSGPSLAKNIQLLKRLDQRALLFAGGSALNVLSAEGIVPHFSASIDPDPPSKRFYEQTAFEVPFFYQDRLAHRLLEMVHSPLLWMADSGGYPIEQWLSQTPPFDGGWNVATFGAALAQALGCAPIIFVGMDLSCTGEQLYAPGVKSVKEEENLIHVRDALYSKPDWLMAAKWIEEFAHKHPECRWINATEGGLGFQGIPSESLESVIGAHLQRPFDLRGSVHARLQQIEAFMPSCEEQLREVEKSLERCAQIADQLLASIEKWYPQPPHEKGEIVLLEFDLEEELACHHILTPLWDVWKHVFQREITDPSKSFINKLLFFKRVIACMKL
jgi:hypothetical protein